MENDDLRVHAIVRLSATSLEAMGYDRDFIPKFQLLGADSVYIIPLNMIVGPLMVIPHVNTHDVNRFKQNVEEWLIIRQ